MTPVRAETPICHLQEAPEFASVIADRCWNAWWSGTDVSLAEYEVAIEGMCVLGRVPSAFVAHQSGTYVGSTLLIECDLAARSNYAPWIAALWVEPKFRKRGVASRLITTALGEARMLGHQLCYLNATDANSPYYEARGFQRIESNVGNVNVFSKETQP
ncbi:MAG: GNAT family N-acetyltransferase [Pseudomonadota bacterium]